MNYEQIISKLKSARSWKEFGISVQEVATAFAAMQEELEELRATNELLSKNNKKLRQEAKGRK